MSSWCQAALLLEMNDALERHCLRTSLRSHPDRHRRGAVLGYLWFCTLTNCRNRMLSGAFLLLAGEGVGLLIGKYCPLGPLQKRLGLPIQLFKLVLPRRAAKAAAPILTGLACTGIAIVFARSRSMLGHILSPRMLDLGDSSESVPSRSTAGEANSSPETIGLTRTSRPA